MDEHAQMLAEQDKELEEIYNITGRILEHS
jgi:hypothetical protein